MKKSLFWLLALVLSPIAVLVIITPMDSQKQYLFGLLSIGILFLMGFSKKRSISVIMVVTSLLMSTRYMYFRLTQTLHFNSTIETVLGMGLFLAEVYIWVMLLLNYLQTVWPLKREIVPLPDGFRLLTGCAAAAGGGDCGLLVRQQSRLARPGVPGIV